MSNETIEQLSINTIRTLGMDAVQKANSGHPGAVMGIAPVVYTLWQKFLNYDPSDPNWMNRDRFVLSIGHASMLLYSILHLAGVKEAGTDVPAVSLDDIKQFRQLGSKTPGHPEYGHTAGVETTTGPLGQGVATSVGMAIASKWLAARYNKPGFDLFGYDTYAICGDGDMMEGIASEAASTAGHLKLDNLCWIYDSNNITIEGNTDIAFTEDVGARFEAYGWNVLHVDDANDLNALEAVLATFQNTTGQPTFIIVKSHIGYGSPNKVDSHAAHGSPLGDDEIVLIKKAYGWPTDESFLVPKDVTDHFESGVAQRGVSVRAGWMEKLEAYSGEYSDLAQELRLMAARGLPADWDAKITPFSADSKGVASRASGGQVLNMLGEQIPWLIGGSADLDGSTKTSYKFEGSGGWYQADNPGGRNFHYGVREHAMSAIVNGLTLSGVRGYGAGFLIFSDYSRAAIRLSALMNLPTIHVFTHDSIGVGEDGPTHQPIEQLVSLRVIPGLYVLRPADANEVIEAWKFTMMQQRSPVVLSLTRQNIPTLDREKYASAAGLHKGAYILADSSDSPDVILIASGSEVYLAVEAYEQLTAEGINARVVSMPSWELFDEQDEAYREQVLPSNVTARVSIEQGSTLGWAKYVGLQGASIGMDSFGASAPFSELQKHFGFTVENIVKTAKNL